MTTARPRAGDGRGTVFLFPGQGSFDAATLAELAASFPETAPWFAAADTASRRFLGEAFLPLAGETSDAYPPALRQLGIFLTGVAVARLLEARGVEPELLVGHSFGELAALTAAGVLPLASGLEIVCQRVLALEAAAAPGGMAAASCGAGRLEELLAELGGGAVEIAVVNHPRQTVVSGARGDLEALAPRLAGRGVTLTPLASPHPFHSSRLAAAVERFARGLATYRPEPPRRPVYLAMEDRPYAPGLDLAALLSSQLTRRLDFARAARSLLAAGHRRFLEVGYGDTVGKLVAQNRRSPEEEVVALSVAGPGRGVGAGLADAVERLTGGAGGARPAEPPPTAIAVVAVGCVVPGAADADRFWENVVAGTSGIVDLAELDPKLGRDFVAGRGDDPAGIVPDKTYTLLNGAIPEVPYDAAGVGAFYDRDGFARLTRGQRLLARALAQAVGALPAAPAAPGTGRTQCILGSTADGSSEYDEALFADSLRAALAELDAPAELRRRFADRLGRLPVGGGDSAALRQSELHRAVCRRLLGDDTPTYVVDSACSSSLYAIDLGVGALLDGDVDRVVAGGVFAPGPANNALFAQFRGLTPRASRPLDAAADGVVFGDGAAVVVLERLPDALAAGHPVLGVIRGVGLASDGRSASVNVPQVAGQSLAIRRAYAASGIPLGSIQLIEAHATATPVGDAVEFRSLAEVFSERPADLPPIQLGSVKALVGHTGWVSGVVSLIKVLQAFAHRTVPQQFHYDEPNPAIALAGSPFSIARRAEPWPANREGLPRRAGIDGFGFGGTDAHLVVEEFDEAYHRRLCAGIAAAPRRPARLAVVAVAGLFPTADGEPAELPSTRGRFRRAGLRLPAGKLLLPDVTEHMDAGQFLAALAAERLLAELGDRWPPLADEIAVVLGVEGKTERGVRANERIFRDRLRRELAESAPADPAERRAEEELASALLARLEERNLPSGPYTLPGLMPNVAASRVSNLFGLRGPNLVVDEGEASLARALAVAGRLLAHGDARLALAGALNAASRSEGDGDAEGVLLVALALPETARDLELPTLATLNLGETAQAGEAAGAIRSDGRRWRGATGIVELLAALRRAAGEGDAPEIALPAAAAAPAAETPATHAYVRGTPIETYTPVLVAAPAAPAAASLAGRRPLVLVDQPRLWADLLASGALDGVDPAVACPRSQPVPGALGLDLDSEAGLAASAAALDGLAFDTLVAVHRPEGGEPGALLAGDPAAGTRLLDLLFAACRHAYAAIGRGEVAVATLSLEAFVGGRLHPSTGLFGGFAKSLARELPAAWVRSLHTDTADPRRALGQLARELGQAPGIAEVCWRGDERQAFALAPVADLAADRQPWLDAGSVVLATGGGRGVTAVLAEELLGRFGCTVVAVGRSDPASLPPALASLSAAELEAAEAGFYRDEMARDPAQKIGDLKRRFAALTAAGELRDTLHRLGRLPGRFDYRSLDLRDEAAVARLVDDVYARYGRLDLVLHGAGVQVSKALPKKSLADFRRIVGTKLDGLGAIYRACRHRPGAPPVSFHLLSSAFSYLGNDGQPDYGAANEALNRLAAALDGEPGGGWSSLAWLGWAGIGMTRGSEFAALAASRRLRGVTAEEGREIFARLVAGRPSAAVNVLLAAGEKELYRPAMAPERPARPVAATLVQPIDVDLEAAPYLRDHTVQGVPTLPGALLLSLAADAARRLRPGLALVAFERTRFRRFVRVWEGKTTHLRLDTRVVEEEDGETLVRVQVLSDFVHRSGRVLERDIVQTEIFVRLAERAPEAPRPDRGEAIVAARELPDPYTLAGSPVRLNGRFKALHTVTVNGERRRAEYRPSDGAPARSPFERLLPNVILVDAFWRFGTVMAVGERSLAVYVPERCDRMGVYFDYGDPDCGWLHEPALFTGSNPRPRGDQLLVGPIEARDRQGRLRLTVDGGVCRKLGEIHDAF